MPAGVWLCYGIFAYDTKIPYFYFLTNNLKGFPSELDFNIIRFFEAIMAIVVKFTVKDRRRMELGFKRKLNHGL